MMTIVYIRNWIDRAAVDRETDAAKKGMNVAREIRKMILAVRCWSGRS